MIDRDRTYLVSAEKMRPKYAQKKERKQYRKIYITCEFSFSNI